MIRFVEFALVAAVGLFLLVKLWPVLTGKSAGSAETTRLQKQIAEAKERLKGEELRAELERINKEIENKQKPKEKENA